jgi:hypothetical protein
MRSLIVVLSVLSVLVRMLQGRSPRGVRVGNGAYKNVTPLPNPPIDAKAMALVLRNVGLPILPGIR